MKRRMKRNQPQLDDLSEALSGASQLTVSQAERRESTLVEVYCKSSISYLAW